MMLATKRRCCPVIFIVGFLLLCVHLYSHFKSANTTTIETFNWVCVVSKGITDVKPKGKNSGYFWYANKKKIYIPNRNCISPQKSIIIYKSNISKSTNILGYRVTFTEGDIPINMMLSEITAYFHACPFTYPENLFHLARESLFPLLHVINVTGQLRKGVQNVAFFRTPMGQCPDKYVPFKLGKFDNFFEMLNIFQHDVSLFEDRPLPDKICYKNAVFSNGLWPENTKNAIEYIKSQLGVRPDVCEPGTTVTIIRRKYRRILNDEELRTVAEKLGFNVRIVSMEKLTLKEQAQLIHCTDVLVGVVSAGLQWMYFMKDHSGVVEIAWPHHKWRFYFSAPPTQDWHATDHEIRPLNMVQLANVTCKINPDALPTYIDKFYHTSLNLTDTDIIDIMYDKRNYQFDRFPDANLAKLYDVIVDLGAFERALLQAAYLHNDNNASKLS